MARAKRKTKLAGSCSCPCSRCIDCGGCAGYPSCQLCIKPVLPMVTAEELAERQHATPFNVCQFPGCEVCAP